MCTFAPLFMDLTMLSTTIQKRWWNTRFLLLFGLAVVNLLFMHGQMAMTVEYEYPFKVDAILSNVFSCLIDATFFFLLSMLLTWGRVKGALLLTFVLTALLSFCNVLYSRFFGHYLPNLAFLQVGNLYDNDVMGSALTGFRWQDLFYILWDAMAEDDGMVVGCDGGCGRFFYAAVGLWSRHVVGHHLA